MFFTILPARLSGGQYSTNPKQLKMNYKLLKLFRLSLIILVMLVQVFPQTRRDPRCVAMAGAYGAVSRGLFAVDYNPANLAFSQKYNSYRLWGGFNFSFSNNFISIKRYKEYNGQDFEANGGKLKRKFISEIPEHLITEVRGRKNAHSS